MSATPVGRDAVWRDWLVRTQTLVRPAARGRAPHPRGAARLPRRDHRRGYRLRCGRGGRARVPAPRTGGRPRRRWTARGPPGLRQPGRRGGPRGRYRHPVLAVLAAVVGLLPVAAWLAPHALGRLGALALLAMATVPVLMRDTVDGMRRLGLGMLGVPWLGALPGLV